MAKQSSTGNAVSEHEEPAEGLSSAADSRLTATVEFLVVFMLILAFALSLVVLF